MKHVPPWGSEERPARTPGHRHLSRRNFIGAAAGLGAVGAVLGPGLSAPVLAAPGPGQPNPIPHTTPGPFGPIHLFFPGPVEGVDANTGHDPSAITDFNGFVGQCDVAGNATGINTLTGQEVPDNYTADLRFMSGVFVGTDGRKHKGTFAFV
jgi:hypothetical protein